MNKVMLILLVFYVGLSAQESVPPDTTKTTVDSDNVKLFIDKINVEGRLEKPQVVLILPGQKPEIDDIQIERSFMKEIFRPVEKRITVETKYRFEHTKRRKDVIEW